MTVVIILTENMLPRCQFHLIKLIWFKMLLTVSRIIVNKEDSNNHLPQEFIKEIYHLGMLEDSSMIMLQKIESTFPTELTCSLIDVEDGGKLPTQTPRIPTSTPLIWSIPTSTLNKIYFSNNK